MERGYIIEKDWITSNGLRAVVLILLENGCRLHRCGYVGGDGYPAGAVVLLGILFGGGGGF